jgi:hypothetical protein
MAVIQQEKQSDQNVVSSHGYVVDNSQEYVSPRAEAKSEASAEAKPEAKAEAAAGEADQVAPEAAAAAPAAEQGAAEQGAAEQGAAGADMSSVLQEIASLKESLLNPQQQQQQGPDPLLQIDEALNSLEQQAKEGIISNEELTMKTIPLIEQRVQINMERKMAQEAEAKSVRDAQGAFVAQNPDFIPFVKSPEAAAMINGNPLLDNVSAFYAAKHAKSEAEKQLLQAQLAEAQQLQANSIKNAGKEQAKIVSGDAGTEAGAEKLFRGDGLAAQQGGVAALRQARAQ